MKKGKLFNMCCCLIVPSGLCAVVVCGVHGWAGLGTPAEDVQLAEDCGNLLLQHEPHQAAVVSNLAGHRRPLQQGQWTICHICHMCHTEVDQSLSLKMLHMKNLTKAEVWATVSCVLVRGGVGGSGGITLCSYCGAPCRFVHLVLSCIAPLRTQIYYRYRDIRALFNYVYTDFVFAIAGQTLSCILMYTSGACFGPKNLHTSSSTHTLKKKVDHQIIAVKLYSFYSFWCTMQRHWKYRCIVFLLIPKVQRSRNGVMPF